ncbi:DUF305 domain-containing protein [Streptomyces sp. ME02-8801-2C]|uniref:DUF305 domain-containing protein n=1 Tax=Streptomyces sp. ME02-8801-2C TaxID=3028680 RepID=UPI0029B55473|nr:DUF305 domain-containing protein [Streptomyces sp. ME02-8801-2C]MDX3458715.1 DUF305 domain-containing protein [Streptomyces sp. ME02-8801-2C]
MTAFTRSLRRKSARRIAAVSVVAAGALLLSACGDDMEGMDHGSGSSSASATADAGAKAGDFNDADVTFAQMMIPHHEQALEMAKLADGRASDSETKKLAGQIEQAQDPEIKTMKGWLESWGKPTAMDSMPGMDHGSGDGMMSDADMDELKGMKGTEFDKMFAEMMIEHHNGAIASAKDEQKSGKNADAKKMAGDIVTSQSAEVKQLQGILDRL